MAATLMEIKSRLLLPRSDEWAIEEDPRQELVRQLLEYKKIKDASALLEAQAKHQLQRLPRFPVEAADGPDPAEQPLRAVELWDLVSAFGRLMRETLALQPNQIVVDETPIQVYMDVIVDRLKQSSPLGFTALFTPPFNRARLVGLFLALLELIRTRQIWVDQPAPFAGISLSRVPPNGHNS
jgi:segregation and condensation protein A